VIRFVKSCIPQTAASYAMILAALTLSLVGLIALQKLTLGDGETAKLAKAIVNKQAASILIALAVMVVLGRVNYLILGRYSFAAYIVSLVLLFLLLVFGFLGKYSSFFAMLVPRDQNSYRWINLGFYHLQPSEFFKFTYILALAWYLRYRKNSRRFSGLVGPFVFTLLPMMLIVLEPDLGTTMLLFPVLMVMVSAAGAKFKHLGWVVLMMVLSFPVLFMEMQPYQRSRIAGMCLQSEWVQQYLKEHPKIKQVIYPDKPLSTWQRQPEGFQLKHSKAAIGTGGAFGYGGQLGPYTDGTHRLPECHNDFIFALIAHQFGFVGAACVILLYGILFTGLIEVASATDEPFGRLIAVGTFAMILTQASINMLMTMGMMPITGITLPMVSYGGSSVLTYFVLVGVAVSVDRTRPMMVGPKPFEFEE